MIGSVLGAYWRAPTWLTGIALAFASGALISALAFELFEEAFHLGGATRAGLGLLAGAATFVLIDTALDRRVANPQAGQRDVVKQAAKSGGGVGFPSLPP